MKKLALLLSLFLLSACDTVQDMANRYITHICYDEVTYLVYDSPSSSRYGITIQLDKEGKVIPCQVVQNEDGKNVYQPQK